MSTLKSLIHEAHRRSLWQVLAVYLAGSFGAMQVVDLLAKNVGLPTWVSPFALVLLVIGLPIVMATAFVQEGPPAGARPAPDVPREVPRDDAPPATQTALPQAAAEPPRAEPRRQPRLLTWRVAILGGIGAFSLLGFTTAGYVALRSMGIGPMGTLQAKGVLGERAPLVVADFASAAGDTLLARAATEAFRVDLAQSSEVSVFEPRQIAQVLRRMQRPADVAIDVALATEVATREGAAAIVAGEINPVGRGFLLTVRLLGVSDSQELVSLRESAADTTDVIGAIDRLSKRLRERIGESYRSLHRGQPLARVTTASLEALHKYSQGARAIDLSGEEARGIALLHEAVALDTAFAMAYRKLGVALSNRFLDRARAVDALTRAYKHRDRLTTRERYLAEASYLTQATWQPDEALAAYENLLELDSMDSYALNNLAVLYDWRGDYERALDYYQRAVRADSSNALAYSNALSPLVGLGRFAEAETRLASFNHRFPTNPRHGQYEAWIASARGDYKTAERSLRMLRDSAASRMLRVAATAELAEVESTRGRLRAAEAYVQEVIAEEEAQKLAGSPLARTTDLAALDIYVRRSAERAGARLEEALRRYPLANLHALDRPYSQLAEVYAAAGRPDRARALLAEYDAAVPAELRTWVDRVRYESTRAELALSEGQPAEALAAARRAHQTVSCRRCEYAFRGRAFDALGQADSALASYERYLETPMLPGNKLVDRWHLASVIERLAALHEQRGDTQKAAEYYNRFIQLWQDADPELQPRVDAARTRLQAIVVRRG